METVPLTVWMMSHKTPKFSNWIIKKSRVDFRQRMSEHEQLRRSSAVLPLALSVYVCSFRNESQTNEAWVPSLTEL